MRVRIDHMLRALSQCRLPVDATSPVGSWLALFDGGSSSLWFVQLLEFLHPLQKSALVYFVSSALHILGEDAECLSQRGELAAAHCRPLVIVVGTSFALCGE